MLHKSTNAMHYNTTHMLHKTTNAPTENSLINILSIKILWNVLKNQRNVNVSCGTTHEMCNYYNQQ